MWTVRVPPGRPDCSIDTIRTRIPKAGLTSGVAPFSQLYGAVLAVQHCFAPMISPRLLTRRATSCVCTTSPSQSYDSHTPVNCTESQPHATHMQRKSQHFVSLPTAIAVFLPAHTTTLGCMAPAARLYVPALVNAWEAAANSIYGTGSGGPMCMGAWQLYGRVAVICMGVWQRLHGSRSSLWHCLAGTCTHRGAPPTAQRRSSDGLLSPVRH